MVQPTDNTREPSHPGAVPAGGGGPSGTEPPSRIHLAIALVAGLALIAVPLALWLGPPRAPAHAEPVASASAVVTPSAFIAAVDPTEVLVGDALDDGVETKNVKLGKVWIDKCEKPGPGRTPPEQCDRQPWFEEALVRAILENTACAPERTGEGTVSVAMKVDHRRRQVKVFAGKSGSIKGRASKGLIKCVRRSIPKPDWDSLKHEHTNYIIAVMATYPAR